MNRCDCLTLDLKDDPELVAEYRRDHHVHDVEMNSRFWFDEKSEPVAPNPKVRQWQQLMWKFQRPLPEARSQTGRKWMLALDNGCLMVLPRLCLSWYDSGNSASKSELSVLLHRVVRRVFR